MSKAATTKRTVRVTITKEIEVEIANDKLTPEALAEFSSVIYQTDDPNEMFLLAARQLANYEVSFIEGIGRCSPSFGTDRNDVPVVYEETFADTEAEIVEPA